MGIFKPNQNYINEWYYGRCNGVSGVPFVNTSGTSGNIYANDQNMKTKPLRIENQNSVTSVGNYMDIWKPSTQTVDNFSKTNFTESACGVITSGYTASSQWQYVAGSKTLNCTVTITASSDISINSLALYEQIYTSSWATGIIGLYYFDEGNTINLHSGESASIVISISA